MSKSYMEYGNRNYKLEHKEYMQVQNRGIICEEQKGVKSEMRETDMWGTKDRRRSYIGVHITIHEKGNGIIQKTY